MPKMQIQEFILIDENDDSDLHWTLTGDGYLVAQPRIARTGIQIYKGHEMGVSQDTVRVFRPDTEVFGIDAMKTFAHRPVTLDHPAEPVNATNWRKLAVGQTGGEVARDGDFLRVPLVLMDQKAIDSVKAGKRQLSVGYLADVDWTSGVTDSGEAYDAVQKDIRANHLAIVAKARGGPLLAIGDDGETGVSTMKITVDGLDLELPDMAANIVTRALDKITTDKNTLQAMITTLETKLGTSTADIATLQTASQTKDGEIIALKQQLKDAELTPQQIDEKVREKLAVVGKVVAVLGDKYVTDGKSNEELRRAVVESKVGVEVTKSMSDAAVGGAFIAYTSMPAKQQYTPSKSNGVIDLASALVGDQEATDLRAKADAAWEKRGKILENSWQQRVS